MPPSRSPFAPIHALVARRTGMALSELQCRRIDEKLAGRDGSTSARYVLYLQSPAGAAELAELIDAISVQKTELFRDEAQLEALRTHVLVPLVARARRPLRLWSAGCATGEEVATLLVMLAEAGADPASTVLGTDMSETAIARARELCFSSEQLQRVPLGVRDRWFVPLGSGRHSLIGHLKERASFFVHNLVDPSYPSTAEGRGFDIIVCRNVLIYFTPASFTQVVDALAERLSPEGLLVLSSAEPLLSAPPSLRTLRYADAFFYGRAPPAAPPAVPAPSLSGLPALRPSQSGLPAVRPSQSALPPVRPSQSGLPAVSPTRPEAPPEAARGEDSAHRDADALFSQVLEAVGNETQPNPQTEETLRRCLLLDPDLAAARYLLGMVFEQRGAWAEAAGEYRRALRSLEEGRARATPFFLNNSRLQVACARAIERVERATPPTSR
ncbi:CheR family methyltransferase [Cystobacter fuscus]|uniref:CheR family methyltransferase n=1 Tax=Cystobacter fuscus TaxID=43 RepID=UPI0037BF850A